MSEPFPEHVQPKGGYGRPNDTSPVVSPPIMTPLPSDCNFS